MLKQIKQWWCGKFTPTPLESVLSGEAFENVARPWPVRAGSAIWQFIYKEWKWLVGIFLAATTLLVKFW